ncbi:hypothetical protein LX82_03791 [Celeribacter halophilus]|uniref:Uncharacterized protein n=2 Tax=Celeribacter halophilus TaxID=576117 RepID=A0A1I3XHN6_9RHOB|nr:hypothetical protein LX82_03791 [Celeribacter halophilus]SFK18566.1 hypothetical protein SAMN04488138_1543 [Celeribacter halophilus]
MGGRSSNMNISMSEFSPSDCYEGQETTVCVFKNNLSSDGMISVISTFYTNLIVILVAILTIIGIIAALSIHYSAKQHVETELPELTELFFTTGKGKPLLKEGFDQQSSALQVKLTEVEESISSHTEFISGFSDRLNKLEYNIENMDTGQTVTLEDNSQED